VFRFFLISSGTIAAIISILIAYIFTNGKIPAAINPNWFYNYVNEFKFDSKLKVDNLLVGGHFYALDGRDLWMRFQDVRSPDNPNELETIDKLRISPTSCNPQELEQVRTFFISVLSHRTPISYLTPWSDIEREDLQSLNDTKNLKCSISGEIENNFGDYPNKAGNWWLYNQKTRFHYFRYANYN
jgi:hypothetical protein